VGLAALALAVVAAAAAVIGAAAKVAAALLSELARLMQAALPWLLGLTPWLLRAAIVTAGVLVVVDAWPAIFIGFGGDLPAAIPATVFARWPPACLAASAQLGRVDRRDCRRGCVWPADPVGRPVGSGAAGNYWHYANPIARVDGRRR